jgi:hypothetical protein
VQMSFGRMASLVLAIVAVLGLFVEIPIISDYAFWVLVGAYLIGKVFTPRPRSLSGRELWHPSCYFLLRSWGSSSKSQ